jgi:hypothetical protein
MLRPMTIEKASGTVASGQIYCQSPIRSENTLSSSPKIKGRQSVRRFSDLKLYLTSKSSLFSDFYPGFFGIVSNLAIGRTLTKKLPSQKPEPTGLVVSTDLTTEGISKTDFRYDIVWAHSIDQH